MSKQARQRPSWKKQTRRLLKKRQKRRDNLRVSSEDLIARIIDAQGFYEDDVCTVGPSYEEGVMAPNVCTKGFWNRNIRT